jgi:hypothetical protein
MNKLLATLVTIMISALFFSSCTIEKRIYSSGYHIEWNKNNRAFVSEEVGNNERKGQKEHIQPELAEQSEMVDQSMNASVGRGPIVTAKKDLVSFATLQKREINKQNVTIVPTIQANNKKGILTFSKTSDEKPKINILAIISFICAIFSFPIITFFWIGIIPSILLGAIAIRQFKNNPGKYKGKLLAIIAVIVGFIGCMIAFFYSLLFALFGGPVYLLAGFIFLLTIIASALFLFT